MICPAEPSLLARRRSAVSGSQQKELFSLSLLRIAGWRIFFYSEKMEFQNLALKERAACAAFSGFALLMSLLPVSLLGSHYELLVLPTVALYVSSFVLLAFNFRSAFTPLTLIAITIIGGYGWLAATFFAGTLFGLPAILLSPLVGLGFLGSVERRGQSSDIRHYWLIFVSAGAGLVLWPTAFFIQSFQPVGLALIGTFAVGVIAIISMSIANFAFGWRALRVGFLKQSQLSSTP